MESTPHERLPLGRHLIERSQESATPPLTPCYALAWTPEGDLKLTVGGNTEPRNPIADDRPGLWTPELWKHDVGELFLASVDRSRYLEINLAPHGAWWSGCFTDPRQPHPLWGHQPFDPVEVPAKVSTGGWETSLTLPASFIQAALELDRREALDDGLVGNVCFILGANENRQHFSWADMPSDPPDFHCPERFLSLSPGNR